MRKINFEEHNRKRKNAKIKILQMRDKLDKKRGGKSRKRDKEKRNLLFRLAKDKKKRMLEKIGERKYRFR